ncbi:hypothetical protein [Streptomyces sp. NPDC007172]|uniref:hypothetical protein n=1 Tax=Streptomyces sp. NPDC007172 TaxID=3364776 RepID=UPI0036C72CE5
MISGIFVSERIRTWRRRPRRVLLAAALAIATPGCSYSSEPETKSTPASALCAGTLDTAAADALHRLAGTDKFTEDSGGGASGRPRQFSLKWATAHLHDDGIRPAECGIQKAKSYGEYWAFNLDFTAVPSLPTRDRTAASFPVTRFGPLTYFPLGATAYVQGNLATLYFTCRTRGNGEETEYVEAHSSTEGHIEGSSKAKDRITILNSVSRRLAKELGCESEANLPTVVPDPDTK